MSWITVIWSAAAGVCLAFGVVHLLLWLQSRSARANLLFGIAACAGAVMTLFELDMMYSKTPAEYGQALRLLHVPLGVALVSLIWFVRFYLNTGRLWLVWLFCGLRVSTLVLTFTLTPNLNFREITGLREFHALGETLVVAIGVKNPWTNITNASAAVLLIFLVDASIAAWRRGSRRRALVLGGTFATVIVVGLVASELFNRSLLPMPVTVSLLFLIILSGIAYELGIDLARTSAISRELSESQERMKLATSAANLGVWEWDIARDEIWVTETIRRRVGLGATERVTLDRFLQSLHPDDREPTHAALRQALEGMNEFQAEYRSIDADGGTRSIATRGRIERGDNGEPLRVRGVSVDITERKQAELALRESEKRFRHVADTAPVLIWMSGTDKLCHYFNQGWFNYTGRSLAQELGNGWAEGVHPDDFKQCLKIYTTSFDARREFSMQYRLRKHDGEYGWVLDTGVPRFAADGQFLGYIGSCVDITAQQEAAERIREAAEFNEKVLASFHNHIAILDRNGTILAVNNAWKEFSLANGGASSLVGVGTSYLEVCERGTGAADGMARRALAGIRSVLEGDRDFFEMEYPCSSPAEFRSFLMRVVPLKTSGGGAVVSHTDITQLRQAELEAQELHRDLAHVQRVAATGQLATTLAHELNQPLGAILRNAEAAELFLQQDPPDLEELRAILADIKRDDQRAGAVIDRMRSLLKKRDLEFEPLGLKELVENVAALMRGEIKMQHATFEIDVPDGLPPVRGDRVQLQQVLLNLVMNSLDALEDLPSERRRLSLTAQIADPQTVEVAVSDHGQGIPAEKLSDIFRPFTTTKPKGLGVGLAVSQTIIATHGGRLWAENNPESGATFRFTLKVAGGEGPVASGEQAQPRPASHPSPATGH